MAKKQPNLLRQYLWILLLTVGCFLLALPSRFILWGVNFDKSRLHLKVGGKDWHLAVPLQLGLDLAGGVQLTLKADMSRIAPADRLAALESAVEVVRSRVDAYGLASPNIQTAVYGDDYRVLVELPGLSDVSQALSLIGTTARMDFRLQNASAAAALAASPPASGAAERLQYYLSFLDSFTPTPLQGAMLKRATAGFDPQTHQPIISLEFTPEGKEIFAQLTKEHTGEVMGIFIDGVPVTAPTINTPIVDGHAMITGSFSVAETKRLAVQLNSGALPVPLEVLSQSQVGASLGDDSIRQSVFAGLVGLGLVGLFMVLNYGRAGLLATAGLLIYAVIIIAAYKLFRITLTLPAIAALMISIGMAVDANILIFSRLKEELALGKAWQLAREASFGRAWESIRDANVITMMTALILINPGDFSFLNTSGTIRGFGITLLLGVGVGLFTSVVVTRTLMRLFLQAPATPKLETKR